MNWEKAAQVINSGGLVVAPTDTIYGILASTKQSSVIDRIYNLKKRDLEKPFVILISSMSQLDSFGVSLDDDINKPLDYYWPGPNTIILNVQNEGTEYLHRGLESLAFRLPDNTEIVELIERTGPIVATSANREGEPFANSIDEAKTYFNDQIDLYLDGGKIDHDPSSIFKLNKGSIEQIR